MPAVPVPTSLLHLQKTALERNDHGMRAIAGVQLREDACNVMLDRLFRYVQHGRDDLVGTALRDAAKYVEFARGDSIVGGVFGNLLRDFRRDTLMTHVNLANRFRQFLSRSEERRVGKECRSRWS